MVEGVQDTPENLEKRFGIPHRLSVRVVALTGMGVKVTASVLEDAAKKREYADFLLSDALYRAARKGGKALRKVFEGREEITLAEGRKGAVIALSEELVAERVLPPALSGRGLPVPHGEETAQSFSLINELVLRTSPDNEALKEEKLRFFTSPFWRERIEALRKIMMLASQDADRAGVLFFALRDEDHRIIGEAVKSFKGMGFSSAVIDALVEFVRGTAAERAKAVERLLRSAAGAGPKEADILLAVVTRLVRDEGFAEQRGDLLKVLRVFLRGRETSSRDLGEIVRLLTRNMPPEKEEAQLILRDLLLSIGKGATGVLCDTLWEEIEGMPPGGERTFLFTLLGRLETRKAEMERLDAMLIEEEIPRGIELGLDLNAYLYLVVRRIRAVFPPLLEYSRSLSEERRALVFRLLGEALAHADLKPGARAHRAKALIALAERSGGSARRAILRARLHQLDDLPATLMRRLAYLFLSLLESEFFPRLNQEIWSAFRALGWHASDALLDHVAEASNDLSLRKECLSLLQRLLLESGETDPPKKQVRQLVARLEALSTDPDFPLRNEATPLLGAALLHPALTRKETLRIATRLVRTLRADYTPGDVGALPFLARCSRVGAGLKQRMIRRVLRILEEGDDSRIAREVRGPDGLVLEMEKGTTIHTQQIPCAIRALQEAALSLAPEEPGSVYMIARTFMRKWGEIRRWRKVWGLESRRAMLLALAQIAASPQVPPPLAAEIFLFLTRQFFRMPHEHNLAEAVALPLFEGRFQKTGRIATKILEQLLAVVSEGESVSADEAGRYLLYAARVASAPHALHRSPEGKNLITLLLDRLEQRTHLGYREDLEALDTLAGSDHLPKNVNERAKALYALAESIRVPAE